MDYKEIFDKLNPGFFDREYIKDMKEHWIFAELVMDLQKKLPVTDPVSCPEGIAFRYFEGNIEVLKKAVSEVDEDCFVSVEEQAEARAKLQCVVDNRLPIYIWHGVNDTTFSWTYAVSEYKLLRDMYHEAGLSEAETDDLVKLYLADDPEYHDHGICEIHATSKLTVWYPWAMDWLLEQ